MERYKQVLTEVYAQLEREKEEKAAVQARIRGLHNTVESIMNTDTAYSVGNAPPAGSVVTRSTRYEARQTDSVETKLIVSQYG